jgi:hypothetical protein
MRFFLGVKFFLVTALLAFDFDLTAQKYLLLNDGLVRHRLDTCLDVYIDSSNPLSFDEIKGQPYRNSVRPLTPG